MLVVALLAAFSQAALLIIAAPLPANRLPTAVDLDFRSTLCRRAPPKFEIPHNYIEPSSKQATLNKMVEYHKTRSTDEQKRARLASVASRWNNILHDSGRQCMKFKYHEGDTKNSSIIGPTAIIYRDRPAPKTHFRYVLEEHKEDMKAEGLKRYNDLGHDRSRVKSMKLWGDWYPSGGIRDKTQFTFHSGINPTGNNVLGAPMTFYRPLTLQLPDVLDQKSIDQIVRAAHKKMVADKDHPASTSNYGTVYSDWHDSLPDGDGRTHEQVVVGLEEVSESEKGRKHLGNYAVRKDTSDYEPLGLNAGGPSSHTGTSYAGPSHLNNEFSHLSSSQEEQHINGPLTHTLPLNPMSPHLNTQGTSPFNTGSPSSRPGPVHSESLHPVSLHQPLPFHTGSPPQHDAFYIPSPELWRPWDPASQPSHGTWQSLYPDLYSDRLWHTGSPRPNSPPSSSQIVLHQSSHLSYPGLSHSGPAQSSNAVHTSQQIPQVGPSSNRGYPKQPDAKLSP